jgi:pimeloyl-ACP methyl ester carboxylesterase
MPEDFIAGHLTPWRVWDRGAARPVLALHCSLAHAGAWSALAEALQGVTITAPDQPSHGRSADWDGQEEIHSLTTRISVAIAEVLNAGGPVDLFGHSFGGTVALRIALERPDLVRSLTLVEPVIFAAARAADDPAWAPFRAAHLAFADLIARGARA